MARALSTSSGPRDHGSAVTADLFAYGTLALDPVIHTLIGRVPPYVDITVSGWRAVQLPDRTYPGLVVGARHTVTGRVYSGLDLAEWILLDTFEDPAYRIGVISDGQVPALAYIWPDAAEASPWDSSRFSGSELPAYLQRCRTWRGRYVATARAE